MGAAVRGVELVEQVVLVVHGVTVGLASARHPVAHRTQTGQGVAGATSMSGQPRCGSSGMRRLT